MFLWQRGSKSRFILIMIFLMERFGETMKGIIIVHQITGKSYAPRSDGKNDGYGDFG